MIDVDLEAVKCLDQAHRWETLENNVTQRGPLAGCAERAKVCTECGGLKIEIMSWRGEIITRRYESDPLYIANARKLADDPNDRRRALREILISRMTVPVHTCPVCGMPETEEWDHDDC